MHSRRRAGLVEIDFDAFLKAARLLYEGPWVAERTTALKIFCKLMRTSFPATRSIIRGGWITPYQAFAATTSWPKQTSE